MRTIDTTRATLHNPVRPGLALRAMRDLLADPEDTRQVFHIIEALSGNAGLRLLERVRATARGRELLGERPQILDRLADRGALEALPEHSLGRAYLRFIDAEGITAGGLVEASETGTDRVARIGPLAAELEWLGERMRDTHDLWHTVTGYRGDLIGEGALLAFTFAQTRNPGIGFVVGTGLLVPMVGPPGFELDGPHPRKVITGGYARGRRAAFLPAVRWESLLDQPLADVRRKLNVDEPPSYTPVRSTQWKPPPISRWLRRAN